MGGDHRSGRYDDEVTTGWTGLLGEDDRMGIGRPHRTPTNNGRSSGGAAPAAGADNDGLSGGNVGRRRRRRRGRGRGHARLPLWTLT